MAGIRVRPRIGKFAQSMETMARQLGLCEDGDQSYLYARAKESLRVIADAILTDSESLPNMCANLANIMMAMATAQEDIDG